MVHDLYIACALLESRQPVQILGRLYRNSTANFDLALAELKWSDDLCGSFTASFLTPQGMADEGFDRLEIFSNGWAARLSLNPQPLEIWTDRHQSPICLNIHDDPQAPSGWLAEELRHMCRVVRGAARVPVGAALSGCPSNTELARNARAKRDGEIKMLDAKSRQDQFPSLEHMTYLNTAAEGIPPAAVRAALERYWQDKLRGMQGRRGHFAMLESAKRRVSEIYHLTPDEVSLCSCSSEAFNLLALAIQLREGDEVVINDLDFPAGATPWLQPNCPAKVKLWRSRDGGLRVEDLSELLSPRTRLVATSLVSFFNGYMINVREILNTVREKSAPSSRLTRPRRLAGFRSTAAIWTW